MPLAGPARRRGRWLPGAVTAARSGPFESPNGGTAGDAAAAAAGALWPSFLCLLRASPPEFDPRPPLQLPPRRWRAEVAPHPARRQLVRAAGRTGRGRGLAPLTVWASPRPVGSVLAICVVPRRVGVGFPGNYSFLRGFGALSCWEAAGDSGLGITARGGRALGAAGPAGPALPSERRAALGPRAASSASPGCPRIPWKTSSPKPRC